MKLYPNDIDPLPPLGDLAKPKQVPEPPKPPTTEQPPQWAWPIIWYSKARIA